MNRVLLVGRITKNIELRTTQNGNPYCFFTVAINRLPDAQGNTTTDWISCLAYNKQAENMAKFLHQGSQVAVEGRLQTRNVQQPDGSNRQIMEVLCDRVQFLDSKNSNQNQNGDYNGMNNNGYSQNQSNYQNTQNQNGNQFNNQNRQYGGYNQNNGYNQQNNGGYNGMNNNGYSQNQNQNNYNNNNNGYNNGGFNNNNNTNQQNKQDEKPNSQNVDFGASDDDFPF